MFFNSFRGSNLPNLIMNAGGDDHRTREDRRRQARTQGRYSGGKDDSKRNERKWSHQIEMERNAAQSNHMQSDSSQYVHRESEHEKQNTLAAKVEFAKPKDITGVSGTNVLSDTKNGKSTILYIPNFIGGGEAKSFFDDLKKNTDWKQKDIVIHGEKYQQPRLVSWFGPEPYGYSGVTLEACYEMPETIFAIKRLVESTLKENKIEVTFNSVLLNRYRNGKDSVAWHSDDELSMGVHPTIASVSLGATRRFEIRRKPENSHSKTEGATHVVHLENGSLLVMDGAMQADWQHQVPKEYHDKGERINLTFRTVFPIERSSTKPSTSKKFSWQTSSEIGPRVPKPAPPSEFKMDDDDFPALGS